MGIILLLFLLPALISWIISLIRTIKNIRLGGFLLAELFIGLLISGVIYLLVFLDYRYFTSEAYIGGSYVEFIVAMILVPFGLGIVAGGIKSNQNLQFVSRTLLISVIISGLLLVFLPAYTVNLPEYLGLPVYY